MAKLSLLNEVLASACYGGIEQPLILAKSRWQKTTLKDVHQKYN